MYLIIQNYITNIPVYIYIYIYTYDAYLMLNTTLLKSVPVDIETPLLATNFDNLITTENLL